jgi:hypothetical protein
MFYSTGYKYHCFKNFWHYLNILTEVIQKWCKLPRKSFTTLATGLCYKPFYTSSKPAVLQASALVHQASIRVKSKEPTQRMTHRDTT